MDKMSYNVMWVVLGAVAMTALFMSPVIGSDSWIVAVSALGIGIAGTTIMQDGDKNAAPPQEKAKRTTHDKYELLMQLMDDDEREAYKQLLKKQYLGKVNEDGELPFNAELFDEDDRMRQ